jgi:hypothetical protein
VTADAAGIEEQAAITNGTIRVATTSRPDVVVCFEKIKPPSLRGSLCIAIHLDTLGPTRDR